LITSIVAVASLADGLDGSLELAVLKFAEDDFTYWFVFVEDENFSVVSKFTTVRCEASASPSGDGAVMRKVR